MGKIKAIVDAAQILFAEKGYENTPVSDIAKAAGVAGGTVIYHFKNKENLLFIVTWRVHYSLFKATLKSLTPARSGLDAALSFVTAFFDYLRKRAGEFQLILKNTAYDTLDVNAFPNADLKLMHLRYLRLLQESLERGIEDGSVRPCDPVSVSHVIYAMLIGSARLHISHGESLDSLATESTAFVRARLENPAPAAA